MSKSIWKFQLEITDRQLVEMPMGANIIHVGNQYGMVCLWAEVDTDVGKESRWFRIYGTGHNVVSLEGLDFVGTVITMDGKLVWHVYEEERGI